MKEKTVWIKKTTDAFTPIDAYYEHVCFPFVGSTILLCNNCEHLLICIFRALKLKYHRVTLGQKTNVVKTDSRIKRLLGNDRFRQLVISLTRTNEHFNRAKHAHCAAYPEIAHDQALLDPTYDWSQVDLHVVDVSTSEHLIISAEKRQAIKSDIGQTIAVLLDLKKRVEEATDL